MNKLTLEILEKIQQLNLESVRIGEDSDGGVSVIFTNTEDKNNLAELAKQAYGIEDSEEALKNLFDELIERFYTPTEESVPEIAKTEKMKDGQDN
jgi:F420-dependent methylenetetrahydromethanopterin dehydrogenase